MEILSTGEKIKRSRIYQGITLKELCGDKISISKMSCIENGKIKADNDILKYLSNKLNIDYNYLIRDVEDEIISNLELIRNNLIPRNELDKIIEYNFNYAVQYSYNNLAFELIHRLFRFYVENNKIENIQLITSQYYEMYQKNNNISNSIIYYTDMANFFYTIKEFNESITYYSKARELIKNNEDFDKITYSYIPYYEGKCYKKLGDMEKAYECLKEAAEYINYISDNKIKGDIYHCLANICIRLNDDNEKKYIELFYEYKNKSPITLAFAKIKNGESYFFIKEREKAIKEIQDGIKLVPLDDNINYVRFLNKCIRILYNNGEFDYAYEIIDKALNLAIDTDDIKLIEEAYYMKGMILQKKEMYSQSEMYMNLSLDALFKFANKEKRHKRYLDMAQLYYNLGEVKESLKYFTLAMNLENN